mgnify:CR=1 FL=1
MLKISLDTKVTFWGIQGIHYISKCTKISLKRFQSWITKYQIILAFIGFEILRSGCFRLILQIKEVFILWWVSSDPEKDQMLFESLHENCQILNVNLNFSDVPNLSHYRRNSSLNAQMRAEFWLRKQIRKQQQPVKIQNRINQNL